ncbi:MAG: hypothetical protein Q4B47_06900, partial [Eubacteriales bacterium]|nr:hypothetical protein [Eubacteriales bacterium]
PETEIPIMEVAVTETPDSEMPITEVPITVVPITDIPDADNTAQIYEKTDEDISGTQIPEIVSAVWNKNLQKIISVRVCSEHGIQILSVHINGQECGWHWDGEMICVEINEQIQKALFKYSDRGSYKQDSRITLSMILLAGDHKLQKLEIDVIPEKGLNLYNYPTRDHT